MSSTKVALITGAGMGIGKAIAQRLANDGFSVAVNDVSLDTAESCAAELRAAGATTMGVQADVSDRKQVFAMVKKVVDQWGRLDVMVSNAGIVQIDNILNITESDFDKLYGINVKGVIWCAQAAAEQMIAQGEGGKIINAASAAAHFATPMQGTYASSKFAVRALTQVMAREFAQHGITVNAYCPGIVGTGMWDTIDQKACEIMGAPAGSMKAKALEMIALGRVQTPEDVAKFVGFLASEDADYITGQNMLADGGLVMI